MAVKVMSELEQIAAQLATSTMIEAQIMDTFRVLGMRASSLGLRKILNYADALDPQFKQLESLFPNARRIVQDFRRSKEILAALDNADNKILAFPANETPPIQPYATPFFAAFTSSGNLVSASSLITYPVFADIAAFLWLVHSCFQATPNLVSELKKCKPLYTCINFIKSPTFTLDDHHNLFSHRNSPYLNDIDKWIEFIVPIFCTVWWFRDEPEIEEIRVGFVQCTRALHQIEILPELDHASHADTLDETRFVPYQRGSTLPERGRLIVHHNAFQDAEAQSLSKELLGILDQETVDINWTGSEGCAANFFEALIITLALATGRTIQGAIDMPIRREANPAYKLDEDSDVDTESVTEWIALQLYAGFKGQFYYPIWKRAISPARTLSIPLPSFLSSLKLRGVYFDGATKLEDCLPYSLLPWRDRCDAWLQRRLPGSAIQIDRRIRDALTRALYYETANPALLTWLTTPISKIYRQAESLSSYLNPLSLRTIDSYGRACKQIFQNRYGAPKEIREHIAQDSWAFSESEHRQISGHFLDAIKQAKKSGRHIDYHNAVAKYLLALLIAATGHRKSYAPFYFAWDILPELNLVFISDKQTVGSEARLVPIPQWISDIVTAYHRHLVDLHNRIVKDHPQLAASIRQVLPGTNDFTNDDPAFKAKFDMPEIESIGQFFIIDGEFNAHTLSTRDIEISYAHISKKGVRNFRSSIAEALWQKEFSGHQIEAFLGHNGNMHSFGESSTWSIEEWAEPIRKSQESYLKTGGWGPAQIRLDAATSRINVNVLPAFRKSNASYEGRSLSNDAARAMATKIIRDLLPPEWFDTDGAKITDVDVKALKEEAKELLAADPATCNKVNEALAKEIDRIRAFQGKKLSSTLTNLTRTESGPVEISFSRHYAIAARVRRWWIGNLGNYSDAEDTNYIDRAAAIGISLIIFDSVLDKTTWKEALSSILMHRIGAVSGCITVRAEITKRSRIFKKSLICTPVTSAQLVGLEMLHDSNINDDAELSNILREIVTRINKWLKSVPNGNAGLDLDRLFSIFKSWWLPHLPGGLHAIAAGAYTGPAPDELSECALYGLSRADLPTGTSKEDIKAVLTPPISESKVAKDQINDLLCEAKGIFELKQQTSRRQRLALLGFLSDPDKYPELRLLANQLPIVSAMLGFLQYMFDEGGKKVDVFRFNSIRTYFSRINTLMDVLWERDIDDIEAHEFEDIYRALLNTKSQSHAPIWLFHRFLRDTYDVPYSFVAMSYKRTPSQIRSSLVSVQRFEEAWKDIGECKDDGQLVYHARTFMSLEMQYGLRTKESLGLDVSHVLTDNPYCVLVTRNNIRDLKTRGKGSMRVVHPLLASSRQQRHLKIVVNNRLHTLSQNKSLFADATKKGELYSARRITQAVTIALRSATGNSSIVPHTMRHTAATRLAHSYFLSPRAIPISQAANISLGEDIKMAAMTTCFRQGFPSWPFWLDRVAMLLGHTSVDTLSNCYWHSSHIRLAEYTWHIAECGISIKPQQLANMLGMERSTIHRKLKDLTVDSARGIASALEATVSYYVNKSNISPAGSSFDAPNLNGSPTRVKDGSHDATPIDSWPLIHSLLCERLAHRLSLGEMKQRGAELGVAAEQILSFTTAYQSIVGHTGITDFEPVNSELLAGRVKRNAGMHGAAERERGLAIAQGLYSQSESFAVRLRKFCQLWTVRVATKSPWFIAHSAAEVSLILEVLTTLGVTRSQLEYRSSHFDLSNLKGILTPSEQASVTTQFKRLSRGHDSIRASEVGIRVQQELDTTIGDHRDTHRLVLVLTCLVAGNESLVNDE